MHVYAHGIFVARGSSEYSLNWLLAPGAWGRWPAIARVQQALNELPSLPKRARSIKDIPISMIYGSDDWMDPGAGQNLVELLWKYKANKASVYVVPQAGHNVFLDAPVSFNKLISALLRAPTQTTSTAPFPRHLSPDGRVADQEETTRLCAAWEQLGLVS